MSDPVRPYRRQTTRLSRPWDSSGKNTGVGCHFLLQGMKVRSESEVPQLCPTDRPHGLQPTRLLRPWDFPGKSSGVGCHCLLHYTSSTQHMLNGLSKDIYLVKAKKSGLLVANVVWSTAVILIDLYSLFFKCIA